MGGLTTRKNIKRKGRKSLGARRKKGQQRRKAHTERNNPAATVPVKN